MKNLYLLGPVAFGAFALTYLAACAYIREGSIYRDISDPNAYVKVIERTLLHTTVAFTDKDPETMTNVEFIARYTSIK